MKAKETASKLGDLSSLIQRASEICEIGEISLDEVHSSVDAFCETTSKRVLELTPISIEDYERDSADWKVAWKEHKEVLIEYCLEKLGDAAKKKKKETLTAYGKRLLFECQRARLGNSWKQEIPARVAKIGKFVGDQGAHEILKRWGGMSKDAFTVDLKQTDRGLIERAAKALGVQVKPTAKAFPAALHKAAARFSNNTTLF